MKFLKALFKKKEKDLFTYYPNDRFRGVGVFGSAGFGIGISMQHFLEKYHVDELSIEERKKIFDNILNNSDSKHDKKCVEIVNLNFVNYII